MKNKEYLMDYMFHYNPYTNVWYTFKRDNKDDYFNKGESYLSAKDMKDILKELHKENSILKSKKDVEIFTNELLNPSEPNGSLKKAYVNYKKHVE